MNEGADNESSVWRDTGKTDMYDPISLSEVLKVWGILEMTVSLPCLSPHLPDPTMWQAMETSAFMHTEGFLLQR